MARQETTKTIINRVAAEVGLLPDNDPYSTSDDAFTQLTALLNMAGQELIELNNWQVLQTRATITTTTATEYALPDDFGYMLPQTQWDRTEDVPAIGPLSPQEHAYLINSDSTSINYIQFLEEENKIVLWPEPQTAGKTFAYTYQSRCWAKTSDGTGLDWTTTSEDIVKLEPILVQKLLKCKFLEAKGFNSQTARMEFDTMFQARTGKDKGGKILSTSGSSGDFQLLGGHNIPDTGFGI